MRYTLLLLTVMFIGDTVTAQQPKKRYKTVHSPKVRDCIVALEMPPEVFTYVEQQPEFRGGPAELDKYLDSNYIIPSGQES